MELDVPGVPNETVASADPLSTQVDDPFFQLTGDRQRNALIGRQGSEENYIDGYIQAAIELASAVVDKRMYGKRDTLVMPILYNARHAIELTLKFVINCLSRMGVVSSHRENHDIMSHWRLLDTSALGDETLRQHIAALRSFVFSLSQIDDDGQQPRFFEDRVGQRSLANYSLSNIEVIRASLDMLSNVLSRMRYRILDLEAERGTGSFTPECSRSDLIGIAQMLPPVNEWRKPGFSEAKANVMKRFWLSGRKFSAAVDIIKVNREMAVIVGLEKELAHLDDQNALFVAGQWSKCHPPRMTGDELRIVKFGDLLREDWNVHLQSFQEMNDAICSVLTPDEIADLKTIFYIGRNRIFCEHYEERLERTRKEHRLNGRLAEEVNHLMEKTDFLVGFAAGVAKLGRPRLSSQLMEIRPDQAPA